MKQKYSCIEYVTVKNLSYTKINSVNTLYLIIKKVNGYIQEGNGNKYLMLVPPVMKVKTQ